MSFGGTAFAFAALSFINLGEMQVLQSTNPVMTALFAWLVVGEQWHWNEFTSASTTILGVFFVVMPSLLSGHASSSGHWHSWKHYAGVLCTLSSSTSGAASFTCMRILGTRVKVHVLVVTLMNGLAQLVLGLCVHSDLASSQETTLFGSLATTGSWQWKSVV